MKIRNFDKNIVKTIRLLKCAGLKAEKEGFIEAAEIQKKIFFSKKKNQT